MSYIVARFAHPLASYEGAPVPVQVFDRDSNQVFAKPVPLSSTGTRIEQDFTPGTYLVRATLPSGEILADSVELRKGQDARAVFRPKRQSPREELSWAYYLQKAPTFFSRSYGSLRAPGMGRPVEMRPKIEFWSRNEAGWATVSQKDTRIFRTVYLDPAPDLQVEGPTMRIVIKFSDFGDWRHFPSQIWLRASNALGSQFIALPLLPELQVLITGVDGSFQQFPFQIQTSNGSSIVESLLSFLGSGDFDSARSVGSSWAADAERLLQDKVSNPMAATVAGYFLFRAGELSRLHDWTENLANWFEWLPDGPVIRAWHLMSKPRQDVEEIRTMLLKAVDRGLPYYNMGLRMLQSGLKLLGQRKVSDQGIKEALQTIGPYLAAADPNAQVTSFVGKDPYHPGANRLSAPQRKMGRNPMTGLPFPIRNRRYGKRKSLPGTVRNKAGLVDRIAFNCNISKTTAATVVDTALSSITAALRKGDRVAVLGFGTFSVSQRKARNGRNPQTGATIKIAARKVAKFSAGAELKKAVNRK